MVTVPTIELRVLGPVVVRRLGDPSAAALLTQPRRLAVFAYLVLARPRGLHARDTLVDLLWPDADKLHGRHALRTSLYAIRRALGHDVIVTAGDSFVGVDPRYVVCDALACEEDLRVGRVDAALERYQGEILRGFRVADAPGFERWLEEERRRLHDAVAVAEAQQLVQPEPAPPVAGAAGAVPVPVPPNESARLPRRWLRTKRGAIAAVAVVALVSALAALSLEARSRGQANLATAAGLPARYASDTALLLRYLRAQALRRADQNDSALAELERLTAEAPQFAPGWAAYATMLDSFGFVRPTSEALTRSREAAERAMALDRTLAEPYAMLAAYELSERWDDEQARRWLDAGLKLHPNDPELTFRLAHWYAYQGRLEDALRLVRRARQLDPPSVWYAREEARLLYYMGRCEDAANVYQAIANVYRDRSGNDYLYAYRALKCLGRLDEAATALQRSLLASGDSALARLLDAPLTPAVRDSAFAVVWRTRLERSRGERPTEFALAPASHYAELGNADSTIMWLDSAFVARSFGVRNVGADPLFDFVRNDPRFDRFLQRVRRGGARGALRGR